MQNPQHISFSKLILHNLLKPDPHFGGFRSHPAASETSPSSVLHELGCPRDRMVLRIEPRPPAYTYMLSPLSYLYSPRQYFCVLVLGIEPRSSMYKSSALPLSHISGPYTSSLWALSTEYYRVRPEKNKNKHHCVKGCV